jgi:hypothetical protein
VPILHVLCIIHIIEGKGEIPFISTSLQAYPREVVDRGRLFSAVLVKVNQITFVNMTTELDKSAKNRVGIEQIRNLC